MNCILPTAQTKQHLWDVNSITCQRPVIKGRKTAGQVTMYSFYDYGD
jgi:hypothetical protein